MDTEGFYIMCQTVGLSSADLAMMNISDALDFVYSWIDSKEGNGKGGERMATQADIDSLFV